MAIHSPHTGIVDWGAVARSFGEDFKENGGKIITGFKVSDQFAARSNVCWITTTGNWL